MIETAWKLGGGKLAPARTRLCKMGTHARPRRSFPDQISPVLVTFGQLRRARAEHRKRQRYPLGERDPWGRPIDETTVLIVGNWAYHGIGYATTPAAELALASAARARDHDRADRAA